MGNEPEIAVITPNTLTGLGLASLLGEIIPDAIIRVFSTFGQLMDDTPMMYAHYFVDAGIYFEHTSFFMEQPNRTIVLTNGAGLQAPSGVFTLNVHQDEKLLAKSILGLRQQGHASKQAKSQCPAHHPHAVRETRDLTPREIEVLTLLVKGYLNKEIADRLYISLTTVITHRKNITEKLGIKSLSGLTVYAVMNGYVSVDTI
jgi:DNA-binding CsgD family transcriptional regulator